MYSKLVDQIGEARSRAAVFYKVDLHVHSNESNDFPKLGDKPGCCTRLTDLDKSSPGPKDFIAAAQKAGLRLIAITDHNKSELAERIAQASTPEVTALPGMEVNLQTNLFPDSMIHVLAIFPGNYRHADIDKVFAGAKMPIYSKRTDDCRAQITVPDFVRAVQGCGGVCIASHVNSSKGVRTMFRSSSTELLKVHIRQQGLLERQKGQTLSDDEAEQLRKLTDKLKGLEDEIQKAYLEFLAKHQFHAVEIEDPQEREHYTGVHVAELGLRAIPCLVGSDAHNLSDIGLSGFTTYVKMTVPGLDDLQKALSDPGTRIRFEHDVRDHATARILGMKFDGGFFGDNTIGFSENLTCLIGGRGTGKSATIEALRLVFDVPVDKLSDARRMDLEDRRRHTLADAEVKVLYQDENDKLYVLKRRLGASATECYDETGNAYGDVGAAVSSLLKIRVFGWGEIEELARSKADQLALIDGFVPETAAARAQEADWLAQLETNTTRIVQAAQAIALDLPKVQGLPGKKQLLSMLSTPDLDKAFLQSDANQAADRAAAGLQSALQRVRSALVQADGNPMGIAKDLTAAMAEARDWLKGYDWFRDMESQFGAGVRVAAERYAALLAELDSLAKVIAGLRERLKVDQDKIETDLNRYAEQIEGADGRSLLVQRKMLGEDVDDLQLTQNSIDRQQRDIEGLIADRRTRIVPRLQAARKGLTNVREAKLDDINRQLAQISAFTIVSVGIAHQGDGTAFEKALGSHETGSPQGLLRGLSSQYKENRYARRYALRHAPHAFVTAVLGHDVTSLTLAEWDDGSRVREAMTEEQAEKAYEHLSPLGEDEAHYDPQKLEALLALEHAATQDLPCVRLGTSPIEDLSPGQRCSALIPIILLEGSCPLVIDQPEDNLDNRLVFSLVVDIMRSLKERRQIIVATHNPNIPVSGDAEQIVVFTANSKEHCEPVCQGSIDCPDIVDEVKAIMEGSEEAFRIRARKYGYHVA